METIVTHGEAPIVACPPLPTPYPRRAVPTNTTNSRPNHERDGPADWRRTYRVAVRPLPMGRKFFPWQPVSLASDGAPLERISIGRNRLLGALLGGVPPPCRSIS